MEQRYIFSGSLTRQMADYLKAIPDFKPMDVLVSQLDRGGVDTMLEYLDEGIVKSLFIDSGAYSVHSQGFEKVSKGRFATFEEMVDEYIEYVNKLDDKIIAVAQFDHIPGKFRQSKSPEDYVESAQLSWENYLYMRPKMKSPDKLLAVQHFGESFDNLDRILNWKDEEGKGIGYCGLSPANDSSVSVKNDYLRDCYQHIKESSNPDVHTHLFGYTSLPGLELFPWYSADSVSHRLRPAYNKVFTNKWGVVSLSKTRNPGSKSDMCFYEVCDPQTLKEFTELAASYNFTIEQLTEESAARTAMDIVETQKYVASHPYVEGARKKTRRLI